MPCVRAAYTCRRRGGPCSKATIRAAGHSDSSDRRGYCTMLCYGQLGSVPGMLGALGCPRRCLIAGGTGMPALSLSHCPPTPTMMPGPDGMLGPAQDK